MTSEVWALVPFGLAVAGKRVQGCCHRRTVGRISTRIHVHAACGKGETTQLIAQGLPVDGLQAVGEVIGAKPRPIEPDRTEKVIARVRLVSIAEQRRTVRESARRRTEALVVECMAIHPKLQRASDRRIVRSQVGVIINAPPDHRDVLGRSLHAVARVLASAVPRQACCLRPNTTTAGRVIRAARDRSPRTGDLIASETERLGVARTPLALGIVNRDEPTSRRFDLVGRGHELGLSVIHVLWIRDFALEHALPTDPIPLPSGLPWCQAGFSTW
jgi:poly-gamma-glutamate synthase PgsB/CapB